MLKGITLKGKLPGSRLFMIVAPLSPSELFIGHEQDCSFQDIPR
jgi:hypothetical protein